MVNAEAPAGLVFENKAASYALAFSINNFLTAIEAMASLDFMVGLSGMLLHEIMCDDLDAGAQVHEAMETCPMAIYIAGQKRRRIKTNVAGPAGCVALYSHLFATHYYEEISEKPGFVDSLRGRRLCDELIQLQDSARSTKELTFITIRGPNDTRYNPAGSFAVSPNPLLYRDNIAVKGDILLNCIKALAVLQREDVPLQIMMEGQRPERGRVATERTQDRCHTSALKSTRPSTKTTLTLYLYYKLLEIVFHIYSKTPSNFSGSAEENEGQISSKMAHMTNLAARGENLMRCHGSWQHGLYQHRSYRFKPSRHNERNSPGADIFEAAEGLGKLIHRGNRDALEEYKAMVASAHVLGEVYVAWCQGADKLHWAEAVEAAMGFAMFAKGSWADDNIDALHHKGKQWWILTETLGEGILAFVPYKRRKGVS
ncbi:hypothetical protein FDENT_3605 [Fusarium denticulatum]|uniref:Uncharacterized protein n=1 Tax=Fusarium denticulatum TaxID=48507 RepID=A0A8H6CSW7_9HYPO|nr:hypothetical protein FDENT_3605 [Fusarium denticulatum]